MNSDLESKLPNADMQAAPRALLRAARRAREVARQTDTAIIVVRDGKLIEEKVTDVEPDAFVSGTDVVHHRD
jgi:hypothetical protein